MASSLLIKVAKAYTKCHPKNPKPSTVTMPITTRDLTPNGGDIDASMKGRLPNQEKTGAEPNISNTKYHWRQSKQDNRSSSKTPTIRPSANPSRINVANHTSHPPFPIPSDKRKGFLRNTNLLTPASSGSTRAPKPQAWKVESSHESVWTVMIFRHSCLLEAVNVLLVAVKVLRDCYCSQDPAQIRHHSPSHPSAQAFSFAFFSSSRVSCLLLRDGSKKPAVRVVVTSHSMYVIPQRKYTSRV